MASGELERFMQAMHDEKMADPYFCSNPSEFHSSKLNPNHCLNSKWRAFKRAMTEGRHPDIPLQAKLRMQVGELIHREIERLFDGSYQKEVVVKIPVLDYFIICKADLVGPDEVVDIKTWVRDKELPSKAELTHLYQLNTYLWAFKKPKGRLWYLNFMTGTDVFFPHSYSAKMFLDVVAYTSRLRWFLQRDEEPPHNEGCRCKSERSGNDQAQS